MMSAVAEDSSGFSAVVMLPSNVANLPRTLLMRWRTVISRPLPRARSSVTFWASSAHTMGSST